MTARAGPSRVRLEDDGGEPSLVAGRARRSTAGNRMKALLKLGLEPEELFEEVPDDNDFEAAQAEPDIIDSDFDESSDEEAPEDEAEKEIEAAEKAERKAEKKKKLPTALRLAQAHRTNIGVSAEPTGERKKRRSKVQIAEDAVQDEDGSSQALEPTRLSVRKSTVARTREVADKLRLKEERAAKRIKREHPSKRPKMTQDALIAEALEVEDMNRESLREYLELEEERKARARGPKRTVIEGPFVRWRSVAVQNTSGLGPHAKDSAAPEPLVQIVEHAPGTASTSARVTTETEARLTIDPVLLARAEAVQAREREAAASAESAIHQQRGPTASHYSRSLVSLHALEEDGEEAETPWSERQAMLFGRQCEWDLHEVVLPSNKRPAHPRQSVCPLTGLPALYQDPRTGVPFTTAEAQHTITDLLDNEYVWTGSLGEAMLNVGCWLSREDEEGAGGIITRARQLLQP